jgi:hypothetical protein
MLPIFELVVLLMVFPVYYIIKRRLHSGLKIRILSSSGENNILLHSKIEFISSRHCVISSTYYFNTVLKRVNLAFRKPYFLQKIAKHCLMGYIFRQVKFIMQFDRVNSGMWDSHESLYQLFNMSHVLKQISMYSLAVNHFMHARSRIRAR